MIKTPEHHPSLLENNDSKNILKSFMALKNEPLN